MLRTLYIEDDTYQALKAKGIEFDKLSKKPSIMTQQVQEEFQPEIPKWQAAQVSKNAHLAFGDFEDEDGVVYISTPSLLLSSLLSSPLFWCLVISSLLSSLLLSSLRFSS